MTVSIKAAGYNFTKFRRKLTNPILRYSGGIKGAIWPLQDLTKVWQNTARTVPAVVGQQVHAIDDISGNGLHLIKNTTNGCVLGQKPDGKYYLIATGAENYITATLTHTATQKAFMAHGFRPTASDNANRAVMNNSSNIQAPVGTFGLNINSSSNLTLTLMNAGSGDVPVLSTPSAPLLVSPRTVVSVYVDAALTANELTMKINNAVPSSLSGNTGSTNSPLTNLGTWPLYLFGGITAGSLIGEWYGGLVHFAPSDAEQQSDFTNYVNELTGSY